MSANRLVKYNENNRDRKFPETIINELRKNLLMKARIAVETIIIRYPNIRLFTKSIYIEI
ncbi:hypothetical protein MACH08_02620 [Oceanobacillus kimchii]|uniref:Transposase n=1 Tax=Oceanobacillus kimchii TaxID=746691 RepID=A0ABQ5TCY9_9BACI|nr:hypothetical protein MACH08_02620 [Oceanobacillus kimchii]